MTQTILSNLNIRKFANRAELKAATGIGDNDICIVTDNAESVLQMPFPPVPDPSQVGEIYMATQTGSGDGASYVRGYFYECVSGVGPSVIAIAQTTGSSLSDLSVDKDAFETQTTTTGTYYFTFDGADWTLDGVVVDLTNYGVSFNGTPDADDVITIEYSASSTIYYWQQLNVQPTPVTSVNGFTGDVELSIPDAIQYDIMPTADATNIGQIVQYVGTTDATYTNGYFYKDVATTTPSSATASQTTGSSLADLAVNVTTFETQITTSGTYLFVRDGNYWTLNYGPDINDLEAEYGITYTGTPVSGDVITVVYTEAGTSYAWTRVDVQPVGVTIDDNSTTSLTKTWSANKLNTTIGDIETLLAAI